MLLLVNVWNPDILIKTNTWVDGSQHLDGFFTISHQLCFPGVLFRPDTLPGWPVRLHFHSIVISKPAVCDRFSTSANCVDIVFKGM